MERGWRENNNWPQLALAFGGSRPCISERHHLKVTELPGAILALNNDQFGRQD